MPTTWPPPATNQPATDLQQDRRSPNQTSPASRPGQARWAQHPQWGMKPSAGQGLAQSLHQPIPAQSVGLQEEASAPNGQTTDGNPQPGVAATNHWHRPEGRATRPVSPELARATPARAQDPGLTCALEDALTNGMHAQVGATPG